MGLDIEVVEHENTLDIKSYKKCLTKNERWNNIYYLAYYNCRLPLVHNLVGTDTLLFLMAQHPELDILEMADMDCQEHMGSGTKH